MNDNSSKTRMALFLILHTLLWVFAMFLTDSIWGDSVSQALVWPFVIANTILGILYTLKIRSAGNRTGE